MTKIFHTILIIKQLYIFYLKTLLFQKKETSYASAYKSVALAGILAINQVPIDGLHNGFGSGIYVEFSVNIFQMEINC